MATATDSTQQNEKDSAKGNSFGNFKMPNIDMSGITATYKKNLEVLGLISKMSTEMCNSILKLQTAFIQQAMTDMQDLLVVRKPADAMAKFSDAARDGIVKAVQHKNKITDMITTVSNNVQSELTKRVRDTILETKSAVDKATTH